ncbi:MAG: hypothetical protein M0R47_16830 [Methylobacter sp.]|uniref:hypothetical protein n=1 Tax=Methylobacter sp. TaxID=2051955 RepID=UPI0025EF2DCF|nr:hypothetical protein [Methylobacter sp.]MCK9622188.1 hypothetical protein [Methylobacter sp.]
MTTQGPLFTGTALIAGAICFVVMELAWIVGKFLQGCRAVDSAMDGLIRALDGE